MINLHPEGRFLVAVVRHRCGFSLIEILIAVGVIGIGILGLLGAFAFGLGAVNTGERTTAATSLARHVLEHVRVNATNIGGPGIFPSPPPAGLDDAEDARTALDDPPFDTSGLPAGANYSRNVQVTYLAPRVAQIRVRIFWSERSNEKVVELVGLQAQPPPAP